MNDYHELIVNIKEYVKGRANEVSHRLSKENVETIYEILTKIEDLELDMSAFDEIIDEAWSGVETF